jgi:lysophospholipid acyltransferase (LPLAT)-like uncharacterized protein
VAKIRIRSAGKILAWLMRGIAATLRFNVTDNAGVFDTSRSGMIWAFWHNKMFLIPWLHDAWFAHVPGTILTSPSGDGQIIADVCAEFGIDAERGSSSKPQQGMSALIALAGKVREGYEIGITPDGPRGPAFTLQPGIVKLGQLTGGAIVPVRIHYRRSLKFKTWDRFELPLPFAKVTIILDPFHPIPRRLSEDDFEAHRAALETTLRQPVSQLTDH